LKIKNNVEQVPQQTGKGKTEGEMVTMENRNRKFFVKPMKMLSWRWVDVELTMMGVYSELADPGIWKNSNASIIY